MIIGKQSFPKNIKEFRKNFSSEELCITYLIEPRHII